MANEPDLTQRLTVTFENTTQPINAEFGVISQIENGKVLYGTTEHWNSTPELVAREGWLYIYSDYKQDEQGNDIAGTKVGDGTTLLSALPFTDKLLYLHVDDSTRHITQEERELWNKSVNALHWLGITTTELTDGASTNPITIDGDSVTAVDGDIVSYNDKEFIFNGSVWQEFGDLSDVYTKSQVDTLLGDKMNKTNPEGVGSFSMNRKPETTVGTNSVTFGDLNTASGNYSLAEGYANQATNTCTHVEGNVCVASGSFSHAEGKSTQASGQFSHAEGNYAKASNTATHAEGYNTKASGQYSHAEGGNAIASGDRSHAEGYYTEASGLQSHAEGYKSSASAYAAHAEGQSTVASEQAAHAEGIATTASGRNSHAEGYETTASGQHAHAEGQRTVASGTYSHAEGCDTTASGTYSHAEGDYTVASGDRSHAEGYGNTASGEYSHAEGHHTIANHSSQHVFGKYNIPDDSEEPAYSEGNYVEIVGNGYFDYEEEEAVRSNIRTLDWNGNEMIAGDLTYNGNTSLTQAINDVNTRIDNLPEPMIFKGTLGVGGTITELPTASTSNEGYTYKVITAGTYAEQVAKVGDVFVSNGSAWVLIPSGDEDSDTWRAIKVNGVEKLGNGISSGSVDFVDTTNVKFEFDSNGNAVKATLNGIDTSSEVDAKVGGLIDDETTASNKTWSSNKISAELEALLPVNSASGAIANFETSLTLPLVSVKAAIVATQEAGIPTPQSPKAISGVSAVSVIHCGANLWDEQWEIGMYSTSTGAKESASTVIRCKNPIAVKGGASYYFKNSAAGVAFQIYKYDRNMNYLGYITYGSGVKNLESEVAFITFNLNTAYGTTYNNNLSVNYPSTDTEYHAYNPNSNVALINLGGTYYDGHFKQDTAGHRQFDDTYSGLINLSDLTFHPTTKGGHTCFYADLPNGVIKSGGEQAFLGKCSTYTVTSNFNMPNDLSCLFYCSELYGGYTRVLIRDDSASAMTGAQFTAYVTGQIVYEKANPQTIALPDGEPIIAFNGVNNVWNDSGDTTVNYKLGIQAYIDKKIAEVQALVL